MNRQLNSGGDTSVTSMVKSAVIGRIVGFLMIASLIALLAWGAYTLFRKYFPVLTPNSKNVGDACKESFECIGYELLKGVGQVECCGSDPNNKQCTKSVQGALGVWACPEDIHGGTKNIGDSCVESAECAGYALLKGEGQVECCGTAGNKHCTKSVLGALGVMSCPEDVVKPTGSSPIGAECRESSECAGYVFGKGQGNISCCQNKCTPLVKDLSGTWWCPNVATGQKSVDVSCVESSECQGYKDGSGPACCGQLGQKKCTEKQRDWVGVWYCPEECVGSFAGKRGTCK